MDPLEVVKKLREEYERALDAAESRRAAYHEAVLDLHQAGTPLREIAQQLGLSHQRVHQIVNGELPRKRNLKRAAGGGAAALVLLGLMFGGLRLAQAPPFAPGAARVTQLFTPARERQITQVALRVARSLGDRHAEALAISQSRGGGLIHVNLQGRFICQGCSPTTPAVAVPITRITLALDPKTLYVVSAKKFRVGNRP